MASLQYLHYDSLEDALELLSRFSFQREDQKGNLDHIRLGKLLQTKSSLHRTLRAGGS